MPQGSVCWYVSCLLRWLDVSDPLLGVLQVRTWSEVYSSLIEDTKGYVEKKQASTYEELVAEQELKAEEVTAQTC